MNPIGPYSVSRKIIAYEAVAFACIILFIWLDELFDIPHLIFGAKATPINWQESLFEGIVIAAVGVMIIGHTRMMFQRMKYLEGILPVCSSCKKIRDENGQWHAIESYIHDKSAARFSHGICPECKKRLYPELFADKK